MRVDIGWEGVEQAVSEARVALLAAGQELIIRRWGVACVVGK